MTKTDSVKQLRKHLSNLFDSRFNGTNAVVYAKDQGFIDGYMQAMNDLDFIDDRELLKIVSQERQLAAAKVDATMKGNINPLSLENYA